MIRTGFFSLVFVLLSVVLLVAQSRPATRTATRQPARKAAPTRVQAATPPKLIDLGVIAKVTTDTVLLRWIPISYAAWSQGVDKGYVVERTDAQGTTVSLTPGPVLPRVEPLATYADTTREQDLTLLSVALYKDGVQNRMPPDQLKQSHDFFTMSSLLNYSSSTKAGVGLADATTSKGQSYTYTVSLVVNPAIRASVAVNTARPTQYGIIGNLMGKATKKTVDMNWDEKTYQPDYPFYIIERSANGVTYERINPKPYMNINPQATSVISFREQVPNKDTLFSYRIRGVDYFGQPSVPSNVVRVMAIPDLPLPTELTGEMTQDKRLTIRWQFPAEYDRYITKFRLSQSNTIDDGYQTVIDSVPSQERTAQVRALSRAVYVRVHYRDVQGLEFSSAPRLVQLIDSLPPVAPVQVAGTISKAGLLTLDWADNTEEDLLGYYVFATNDSTGTPTRITDTYLTKSAFQDSVAVKGVANKKMYYSVLAVDTRYNHSALSRVAVVNRPDLVPPTRPNFVDYEVVEKRITLNWVNPTDDDIRQITLRRRPEGLANWTLLQTYGPASQTNPSASFADTTVAPKTRYEYDLLVEDEAGNTASAYQPLVLKSADELIRIQFTDVTARFDPEKQQVIVTWKADRMDAIASFIVQREYPGEELTTWQVIDAPESVCVDEQLHKDVKHTYVIQAKLKEGYVSPTSAQANVQL